MKIKDRFYENMTNNMKDCLFDEDELKAEFLVCHQNYLKATAARAPLPHVNENGINVVHGANMTIKAIAQYWEVRRDAIKDFLPRKWVDEQGVSSIIFKR